MIKNCIICKKEIKNPDNHTKTCSKKCSRINTERLNEKQKKRGEIKKSLTSIRNKISKIIKKI